MTNVLTQVDRAAQRMNRIEHGNVLPEYMSREGLAPAAKIAIANIIQLPAPAEIALGPQSFLLVQGPVLLRGALTRCRIKTCFILTRDCSNGMGPLGQPDFSFCPILLLLPPLHSCSSQGPNKNTKHETLPQGLLSKELQQLTGLLVATV